MVLAYLGRRLMRRVNPAGRGTRAVLAWSLARWAWNRWNRPRTIVLDPRASNVVEVTSRRDRRRGRARSAR